MKRNIPIDEQKVFTGIHIEFDTTSEYATKKDMKYISWALKCIAYTIDNNLLCGGVISGGTKWWLEKEEQ